jgi:hypothetical protein
MFAEQLEDHLDRLDKLTSGFHVAPALNFPQARALLCNKVDQETEKAIPCPACG